MLAELTLGEVLQRTRRRKGLLQKWVAKEVGVTNFHLSRVERGHTEPSVELLIELAKVLDMPLEQALRMSSRLKKG